MLFINNRHKASEEQNELMRLTFTPNHRVHSMTKCECCKYLIESTCTKHKMILAQDTIGCDQHIDESYSNSEENTWNEIFNLYRDADGWSNRCKGCGIIIHGTHHMEEFEPECMNCYCKRL